MLRGEITTQARVNGKWHCFVENIFTENIFTVCDCEYFIFLHMVVRGEVFSCSLLGYQMHQKLQS